MNRQEHIEEHKRLHKSLDELVSDFIKHTEKLPSNTAVVELMNWSYIQTKEPDEED